MKIDKDFAVKVDGKVFTANEIRSVSFDIAWFTMNCISDNGTRFTIEASLKDVEFLTTSSTLDWHGYEVCGDHGFFGPPFGSHKNDTDMVTPLEQIKKALYESMGITEPDPNMATESSRTDRERALFGPFGMRKEYTGKAYCKVGDEPKSDIEVVPPLSNETEKSTDGFIEEMLHKAVLEARAADQRYFAKLAVDIIQSGG